MARIQSSCFPEDFHDEFLGEVGAHFLVGANEDVVLGGVPPFAQRRHGIGMDESGDHAAVGTGMEETEFWAQGFLGGDGGECT